MRAWAIAGVAVVLLGGGLSASEGATVAAGAFHTVVRKADGTVWAWGRNANGQLGVNSTVDSPLPIQVTTLSNVAAVAAGASHTLALKADGTVWSFGSNAFGQLGDGSTTQRTTPVQVTGLPGVAIVEIAAGSSHSMARTANGQVWAWGRNTNGQIGDGGTLSPKPTPQQVTSLPAAAAIAAGGDHSLAATTSGALWAWGKNGNGQLGDGTLTQRNSPVAVSGLGSGVVAVAAGGLHSLALTNEGTVLAWGQNAFAQLGDWTLEQKVTPVPVPNLDGVQNIAAADFHSMVVLGDGTLWGWGYNDYGEVGDGTVSLAAGPRRTIGLAGIVAAAAGANEHTVAVTSTGEVWAWGYNPYGEIGDGTTLDRTSPTKVSEAGYQWKVATPVFSPLGGTYSIDQNVTISCATPGVTIRYSLDGTDPTTSSTIYTGTAIPVTVTKTLKAKTWLGTPSSNIATGVYTMKVAAPTFTPAAGTFTSGQNVSVSSTSPGSTIRYTLDGSDPTSSSTLYSAAVPIGTTTTLKAAGFKTGWTTSTISAGAYIMNFGTLASPIISPSAGTFVGSVTVTLTPPAGATARYTTDGTDPSASSTLYAGPFAVTATATVKAKSFKTDWTASSAASTTYTIQVAAPVLVPGAGQYPPGQTVSVTCATPGATIYYSLDGVDPTQSSPSISSGGTLFVGNYTLKAKAWATGLTPSATTSAAYTLSGPITGGAVAAGSGHSLALKTDGTAWAWGANTYGQLGDASTTQRATPVAVSGLTGVTAIAAGLEHSLAVKSDGTVYAWGRNQYGQIGNGTSGSTPVKSPAQVTGFPGGTIITAVAAGQYHSLALTSTGAVYAWGRNNSGQIGNGTSGSTTVNSPTLLTGFPGGSVITAIGAGQNHSLAVRADGTAYAWGLNANGQLGDGTTTMRTLPNAVPNLAGVLRVAGGAYDSLAVKSDGTAWSWGYRNNHPTNVPLQETGLTGATLLRAGVDHFLAVEADYSLWAWGSNDYGKLGIGAASATPVRVAGLPRIVSASAGDGHSLAVGDDGSVWSWGRNNSNQLGDGTTTDGPVPLKVAEPGFLWKAGTPVFNPVGGTYNTTKTVAITSSSSGGTIYYTTNGSTPTTSSNVYSAAVAVNVSTTLKAKKIGGSPADSNVATALYVLKVAAPTLSSGGGSFGTPQTRTVTCSVAGAQIRYTTNGVDPTLSDSPVVSGGTVAMNQSLTLKVRAFLTNWDPSDVVTANFTLKVATPTLSPAGGAFTTAQNVTVSTTSSGTTLHYSTNGLEPTESDPVVASGAVVAVSASATLKVKGFRSGWTPSDTGSGLYILNLGSAVAPAFSPAPGTYTSAQMVTLTSATPGAEIRYTLDGSTPTAASWLFAAPIPVSTALTLKAQAFKAELTPSTVASGTYQINLGAVAAPTFSKPSGVYAFTQSVVISTATAGATIYYTTNGLDPTVSDPSIASGGTLSVDRALILKAAAFKSGLPTSAVTRADYRVTGSVAAGDFHSLGLQSNGDVWAWGTNSLGQLGLGDTTIRYVPVKIPTLSGIVAIAAGGRHSIALDSNGWVWTWGFNQYGQLGLGDTTQRTSPVKIASLSGIVAIAAGANHSLAVTNTGTLHVWGQNASGQLGDGTSGNQRTSPYLLPAFTGVVAVAAGSSHSLALLNTGTLKAWGVNTWGQIGDGTLTTRTSPTTVPNLSGVSSLEAGGDSSLAIRSSSLSAGTLWAWGKNDTNQLGDGTATDRSTPVRTLNGAAAITAGDGHGIALASGGVEMAWGLGASGQLGNGQTKNWASPVRVIGLTELAGANGGANHNVAVRADGGVWVWGSNAQSQLGLGSGAGPQSLPVPIPAFALASNAWMLQDTDGDGLTNAAEYRVGSDPLNPDTNQDGIKDGLAVAMGKSPTAADMDGDGLQNAAEAQKGTNPFAADSDGDGTVDGTDCYPLDPSRSTCGTSNPNDHTGPGITLIEPANVVVTSPIVTVSATTVSPGATVQVTVANGPANVRDWVGLHATAAVDTVYVSWKYLNGLTTPPATGLTGATLTFTMPTTPGTYNFRFFLNNTYTKLASSPTVTIQ